MICGMDATGMQPRPRLAALTWRGGWVLVGSLVLVVAGAVRVDGALAALGLAGWGGAAVAYAVGRWNLGRIAAEVEAPARVFAGATFPVRVTLHNRRVWLDGFGVEYALDLGGGGRAAGVARWIPAGAAADLVLRASVRVRGRHAAHDFRIASSFPLGLFRFRSDGRVAAPLLAFPRPLTPVELLAAGVRMDAAPLDGASPGDAPGEPRGLRGYRSGDRPRRIHWGATVRALAAGRPPVVRENDPPGFHPAHAHEVFH